MDCENTCSVKSPLYVPPYIPSHSTSFFSCGEPPMAASGGKIPKKKNTKLTSWMARNGHNEEECELRKKKKVVYEFSWILICNDGLGPSRSTCGSV